MRELTATVPCSSDNCEYGLNVRERFAVLETLGKHPQRKRLGPPNRFLPRGSVAQHAWKLADFGDPAAIFFLFNFNTVHDPMVGPLD